MSTTLDKRGCAEFWSISTASNMLVVFLVIGSLALVIGGLAIGIFLMHSPTLLIRRVIMTTQALAAVVLIAGAFLYMSFGGTLGSGTFFPYLRSPLAMAASSGMSFNTGCLVLVAAGIWGLTLPGWSAWCLKLRFCKDYHQYYEEEETKNLVNSLQHGTGRPSPSSKNIIDWFHNPPG